GRNRAVRNRPLARLRVGCARRSPASSQNFRFFKRRLEMVQDAREASGVVGIGGGVETRSCPSAEAATATKVVAQLNDRWRVVFEDSSKPDHRQWVLQYRKGKQWTSNAPWGSFCQTRAVLLRCIKEKVSEAEKYYGKGRTSYPVDPAALALIEALPERVW